MARCFYKGTLSNRQVTPEVLARYHRIYGNTKSQVGAGAAGAGLGAVLGGAIDGWGGYEIGKAVSGGSDTGGMIGGAVGGLAGFAALAAGGPVGWGIAGALALGGIAAAFYNANAASEEARKSLEAYTNSLSNNGLLSEDHFSMTERYLNLVYNKELDIKNVIEERINLRNQELGLTSGKNTDSTDWSGKVFDSMLNKFDGVDKFYSSSDMARSAIETVNRVANTVFKANGGKFDHPNGKVFYNAPDDNIYWVDARGNTNKIVNPGGWNDVNDVVAAMSSLYLEGLNGSKGSSVIQSMENRMRAAMMTGNYRDFIDIKNSWQKNYGTLRYTTNTRPDLFSYGINDVKSWTAEDKVASYPYQQGLYDRMNALYGANSQRWKDIDAYWNASKNNKLTEDIVVKYISAVDSSLGALLVNYTSKSFDDWIKGLGYLNGTFQSKTQAEYAKTGLEDLLKVINALGTPAQDATTNLFKLAVQLNGIANGFLWNAENGHGSFDYPIGGLKVGDTKTVDGTTYKYDGKMWNPMNSMIMRPVDNNTMQGMVNRQKKVGSAATGGRNGRVSSITPGTHNGKVGASQADYKQHYNNKTAAPKQVIVKIENLMNVKSIDLSKKDNQEVIDNVKAQLTQALVDVVHDFDDTWNG